MTLEIRKMWLGISLSASGKQWKLEMVQPRLGPNINRPACFYISHGLELFVWFQLKFQSSSSREQQKKEVVRPRPTYKQAGFCPYGPRPSQRELLRPAARQSLAKAVAAPVTPRIEKRGEETKRVKVPFLLDQWLNWYKETMKAS